MSATSTQNKINKCEVCVAKEAKYTCPKCEVRTCSLPCVNIHKRELSCDGIRDKVGFKAISKMNNLDLLTDYRLLEEVTRSVENYARDKSKMYTRCHRELPIQLFKLRAAANTRNVRLHFLPQNFSRHESNTTYFDWKTQIIYWRVEWIFPQAENIKCVDNRSYHCKSAMPIITSPIENHFLYLRGIKESERLGTQVDRYLNPQLADHSLRSRLQWYQAAGVKGVQLLLKAEHVRRSGTRFYELDPLLTLQENLQAKSIIEFPTIYVILRDHHENYDILNSDEEEEIAEENAQGPDFKRQRTGESPHSSNDASSGSKNLLFHDSDGSDVEEVHNRNPPMDVQLPSHSQAIQT